MIKICPASGKQQEVVDILLSVRGPTLAASGCLECSIYEEHDEEYAVLYLEEWQTMEEMITHIRSPLYSRLLKSLELSDRHPKICFLEVSATQGIELIERERSSKVGIPQ